MPRDLDYAIGQGLTIDLDSVCGFSMAQKDSIAELITEAWDIVQQESLGPEPEADRKTINRYMFVFSLPVVEILVRFGGIEFAEALRFQYYLTLHGRFLDHVLDDDSTSITFQSSLYLANRLLDIALDLARNSSHFSTRIDRFWQLYRHAFEYDRDYARAPSRVFVEDDLDEHWKRISYYYFALRETVPDSAAIRMIERYIDTIFLPLDYQELIIDQGNAIETIPGKWLRSILGGELRFSAPGVERFIESFGAYLRTAYAETVQIAQELGLTYLSGFYPRLIASYFGEGFARCL